MRDLMAAHFPKWEGSKTAVGLNLVLDKHMAPETHIDANIACANFLEQMLLPKDQIAAAMMERARLESASEEEPWRLVYLLRQMEKMIDREKQGNEVVPFIASFLNDKRPTEPLHRGPESVPRQQRRVCDGAKSALVNYMEETGLCEKYDARFGNPGGEAMQAKRDEVIRAVVQALQEKSFLPADFWASLPPPRLPKTTADANTKASTPPQTPSAVLPVEPSTPKAPEAKPTASIEEPTSSTPWSVIIVLIVAAIGLLWLLVKKRK
jgi:hypothetical protein